MYCTISAELYFIEIRIMDRIVCKGVEHLHSYKLISLIFLKCIKILKSVK